MADLNRTHHLECDPFAAPFRSLLERVLPSTTTAIVRLREDEMETEPDGDECRRTWSAVRDRFERVPDADGNGATAWRCSTETGPEREALRELCDLTGGIAGQHFVFRLELRDGGTPVLESIPHHSDAGIDATRVGDEVRPGEIVGLEGHRACLVPAETHLEWVAEDRRWRLDGGGLCVETLDGRKTTCYGLTNVQRATIRDGTVLVLGWDAGGLPDDPIGRLLSWTMDKLYDPPTAVPCGTPERATEARTYVAELLDAYDGREL